ncbi:RHTO0S04e05776g1_1 [Rhodotorula toruloides]|uniref:RHTO0S04e05776g1_1 n=1 Tax=Rhodotorula toruloides TaxID=5286 RepID=A0A061AXS2_RHOTO|nr:RHTO0S04e05776g1_1 [Rhodotorula toruloides]
MHYIVYSRIFEELNCPTVSLLAPSLKAPRLLPRTDSTAPNLQV